jgi:transposase
VLSNYAQDGGKSVHEHDITTREGAKPVTIEVPILKGENFGERMAIDEKHIGEEWYTIMSNRETGKIALLCKSIKYSEIKQVIQQHCKPYITIVKRITRDFSSLYEKVCEELFPWAIQIGDKVHVIFNLMDAHQSVRIRYRQKELDKRRKAFEEFKSQEKQRMEECERVGENFKPGKFNYKEQRLDNGETPLELLAHSRYLLYKFPTQWTISQTRRAQTLFNYFPEIERSYDLCCQFRNWLSKGNIEEHFLVIDKQLHQWYENVENADIDEILTFKSMVESNEDFIKNYFTYGETNAIAEAINSKIQNFISTNKGNRDKDFFFSRLDIYYS